MKKILLLLCPLLLAACVPPPPVPVEKMLPPDQVYDNMPKKSFLDGSIALGEVSVTISDDTSEYSNNALLRNYGAALESALEKSKLRAKSSPAYKLNARLIDVKQAFFGFTEWESGSTADYEIVAIGSGKIVYKETVAVPYTQEKPIFMSDMQQIQLYRDTLAGAVRENVAHVMQKLKRLHEGDLK